MRVAELGGDVQLEVRVVVELLLAQLHDQGVALLRHRLRQHWLQRWVELFTNVLNWVWDLEFGG